MNYTTETKREGKRMKDRNKTPLKVAPACSFRRTLFISSKFCSFLKMHHRITKTCQARRTRRAERLRELLQLSPADDILMDILLDTCARKSAADGKPAAS